VHAAEENGPGDLTGVLALQEEGLGLTVDETEGLFDKNNVESGPCYYNDFL
jgi:hypothetical protein